MKISRSIKILTLLFLVLLGAGFITEHFVLSGGITKHDIRKFNLTVHQKQIDIARLSSGVKERLNLYQTNLRPSALYEYFTSLNKQLSPEDMALIVTLRGKPLLWTNNMSGFADAISLAPKGLVQLSNGWYLIDHIDAKPYVIHSLILIKTEYKIENGFLKNEFASDFHLPNSYKVLFYKSSESFEINDRFGQYVFSVKPSLSEPCIYSDLYFPTILYGAAFLVFMFLIFKINNNYFIRYNRPKLVLIFLLFAVIYMVINHYDFPGSVFMLDLFSPKYFAYSNFWSSLGSFILFAGFLFFLALCYYRTFNLPDRFKKSKNWSRVGMLIGLLFSGVLFLIIEWLVSILVLNSSLSFAIYRVGEINVYSFVGFFAILLLYLAFVLISTRTIQLFRKQITKLNFLVLLLVSSIAILGFSVVRGHEVSFQLAIFYIILGVLSFFYNRKGEFGHQLTMVVAYVSIFSLFTLLSLMRLVDANERKVQELKAINLFEEHDPTAELYLLDIDNKIQNDTTIYRLMFQSSTNLEAYLIRKYFSGYLREFDLQLTICNQSDSLIVQPDNEVRECLPFFKQMINSHGNQILGSHFYYIENMNGRISYMGHYSLRVFDNQQPTSLFIELNSRFKSEGMGFPELLVPKNAYESLHHSNMSFAKYYNGELVDRGGSYGYALNASNYKFDDTTMSRKRIGHYEHFIYKTGKKNYIVVTRRIITNYEYIKAIPYLFIFFFVFGFLLILFSTRKIELINFRHSLQSRIQLAIVGVVFFALLAAGSGTLFYNISEYRNDHKQNLADKINSVSTEISQVVSGFGSLSPFLSDYLTNELIRISEVFYTDINIFDIEGNLIATSRPEIYEKGLIAPLMNNNALTYLGFYQHPQFIHNEHIGRMDFLSAYVPLVNQVGETIGYVNIPYFTQQQKFSQQVTTFILAFINLYVFLLMMSILIAYYISRHITGPLKMIRESLRSIQLGRSTKSIHYQSDDEIGMLVREYNQKLYELAESTELLARNEREMAWREMAKQIAHEIKNPLTPMKLNIQFLQRTQQGNSLEYDEKIRKITGSLIEQIDNLSSIATEFSNFAKMPNAQNEVFDPAKRLHEIIDLYVETGQSKIIMDFGPVSILKINADKEQFSRAIINLVRNAIQAIPEDKDGYISIHLNQVAHNIEIEISDNGKGIKDEFKEKIFVPNFTTKTSGTGLGLAITRNIIESFGGTIWFESHNDVGTSFFIQLPLID